MESLVKSLFNLLKIKDAQKEEESEFRDLVETLQSTKYTSTNSDTQHIKRLLDAAQSEDPTNVEPILDSKIDWDCKNKLISDIKNNVEPDKPKVNDCDKANEKGSEFNRCVVDETQLVINPAISKQQQSQQDNNNVGAIPPTEEEKELFDNSKGHTFSQLLYTQVELMKLLKSEYDNYMPAPPVHQTPKFGKQGGRNFNLPRYDVPDWIMETLVTNSLGRLDLKQPLTSNNYVERFQILLWLEEAHQMIQMRRYDMANVLLANYENSTYLINVPGLAEGRPSLMRGDSALLKSSARNCYYQAHIIEVRQSDIIIRAHESLRSSKDGLFFDVHFISSRTPFRRCHYGITQYRKNGFIQSIVFPMTRISLKPPVIKIEGNPAEFRCFMRDLNLHQRNAVINVLENRCRPVPYIIFGPPGTGKTVTLVEAIFQIYARKPDSKILVCANSNASADLIAKRVYEKKLIDEGKLVRVSAFYRFDQDIIPDDVKPISKEMDMISASVYQDYRIVITTCIQSGSLYEFKDRFDYVLIDEAGHANEAEVLITLGLMKPEGACAFAGDPHQLGPVVTSDIAKHHGLGTSLLERIFKRACYLKRDEDGEKNTYHDKYITKLITSYRCDPRLMVVNNKHFYDNELKFVTETPKKWLDVVKADSPLIYHEVNGIDRREYLNPSWFNANEAIKCMIYVNSLYRAGLKKEQLGIITPYRRQIDKIKTLFASLDLPLCKVATMEEFQGDEREVIIISTVRSRVKNLQFDKDFNLGFLFDPKRFNVGISRAKWLVIVVGHPEMLKRNQLWLEYMENAFKPESSTTSKTATPQQKSKK